MSDPSRPLPPEAAEERSKLLGDLDRLLKEARVRVPLLDTPNGAAQAIRLLTKSMTHLPTLAELATSPSLREHLANRIAASAAEVAEASRTIARCASVSPPMPIDELPSLEEMSSFAEATREIVMQADEVARGAEALATALHTLQRAFDPRTPSQEMEERLTGVVQWLAQHQKAIELWACACGGVGSEGWKTYSMLVRAGSTEGDQVLRAGSVIAHYLEWLYTILNAVLRIHRSVKELLDSCVSALHAYRAELVALQDDGVWVTDHIARIDGAIQAFTAAVRQWSRSP